MATTVRRFTYGDLESIPQERPGDRHELINGELVVTPSPIPAHQIVSGNIEFALAQHVWAGDRGMVLHAPLDIRLTPDTVLIPDIIFITRDRLHVIGPKTVDAPPDLVVEILSPGTGQRDLGVKRVLYARFGVREYWIVDPGTRNVTVLTLAGDQFNPLPVGGGGAIQSRVLPELELALDEVVAGVP